MMNLMAMEGLMAMATEMEELTVMAMVTAIDGNDNHSQLQRWLMAAVAMTYLPLSSLTMTGWCGGCHLALARASAVTIAAAFANVIASLTLLSMVGCCVICRPLPAGSSAVQICQPPPRRALHR